MSQDTNNQSVRPNYYAIIPANVRYCKDIEMGAKLLYAEISSLTHLEGYCWASNKYFAELYDVDESTIKRWLSSLKTCGFIEIDTQKNGILWDRKIWISPEVKKMFTKGQKCPLEGSNSNPRRLKNEPISNKSRVVKEEEKREGASPPTPPPPSDFFSFGRVKILSSDREKLIEDFGATKVQQYVERLNEFADINPKRFKTYGNHAAVIRKWIREDQEKKTSESPQKNSRHHGISAESYEDEYDFDFRKPAGEKS